MILLYLFVFGVIPDCDIVIKMAQKLGLDRKQPKMYAYIQLDCCLPYQLTRMSCFNGYVDHIDWSGLELDGDVTDLKYPSELPELYLHINALTGNLNFKLPSLNVDMSNNKLSGTFNATIPSTMDTLFIDNNDLEGYLDFDFHGSVLGVSRNKFVGNLPRLYSTSRIYAEMNQLNGTLINKLPASLSHVRLNHNQFSGEIGVLPPNADTIILHDNLLSGNLTGFSTSLTYFATHNNLLTGNIPNLVNLATLVLGINQLSGIFEPNVIKLNYLSVKNNNLTGNLSHWISAETVQNLDISNNHFYGEISILKNNCNLNITNNDITSANLIDGSCSAGGTENPCVIQNNPISNSSNFPVNCQLNLPLKTGYGCEQLAIFAKSMKLDVTKPDYYESLLQDCCSMIDIICKQGIIDQIDWYGYSTNGPDVILDMDLLPSGITIVALSSCNFVKLIGQVPQYLKYLDISMNKINGTLPDFSQLKGIVVSFNQFSGPVPQNFPIATKFLLNNNNFNGTLPQAPNAFQYSANDNQFSGSVNIPSSSFLYFEVQNNLLSGPITDFQQIYSGVFRNNLLSGTIPVIPNGVSGLDLSFNLFTNLTGPFPASLSNLYLQSNKIIAELPTLPLNMWLLAIGMPNQVNSNQISGEIAMLQSTYTKYLFLYNNSISNIYIAAPNTLQYCDITKNPILNYTNLGNCVNNSDSFLKLNVMSSEIATIASTSTPFSTIISSTSTAEATITSSSLVLTNSPSSATTQPFANENKVSSVAFTTETTEYLNTELKYQVFFIHLEIILTRRLFFKTTANTSLDVGSTYLSVNSTRGLQTKYANLTFKPSYKLNEFVNLSLLSIVKLVINSMIIVILPSFMKFERKKKTKRDLNFDLGSSKDA
eukprot:NODE_545_length_6224_cov_0.502857.p1 type:complete len:880 gc:universal NODE_545_length_6224_cov_0.502857:4842-2203(-)